MSVACGWHELLCIGAWPSARFCGGRAQAREMPLNLREFHAACKSWNVYWHTVPQNHPRLHGAGVLHNTTFVKGHDSHESLQHKTVFGECTTESGGWQGGPVGRTDKRYC